MAIRDALRYTEFRGSKRIARPTTEPVSLTELKKNLRIPVDNDSEDLYQGQLIIDAVDYIEERVGIGMIDQTWQVSYDRWPGQVDEWWDGVRDGAISEIKGSVRPILLPRYPLKSVDAIKTYNEDSVETVITIADVFDIDTISSASRIALKKGATWPTATRSINAIIIEYTIGFGPSRDDVPPTLRRAVLEMASYLNTHRGDCTPEEAFAKSGASGMVSLYRRNHL